MKFYPFHIGDYTARTAHLSPMEDLAYRRMLDLYYVREGPLPESVEQIARLIRMADFVAEVRTVLSEFFALTTEGWEHDRCEQEIAKFRDKSEKAKAAIQSRWNRPNNGGSSAEQPEKNERSTDDIRTYNERSTNQEPITKNQEIHPPTPRKRGSVSEFPPGFAEFWEVYPRHTAKANAQRAWAKLRPDPPTVATILKAVEAQKQSSAWAKDGGQFIPHPATWLNGRRWEDEAPTVRPVGVVL